MTRFSLTLATLILSFTSALAQAPSSAPSVDEIVNALDPLLHPRLDLCGALKSFPVPSPPSRRSI
jgi:hypothetical protein